MLTQAVQQTQQAICLLHGLAAGEGYAFQYVFLACPKHVLSYGINCHFTATKRMGFGIPASSAMKRTALEEHHCSQAWPISTAGWNQRMKQHDRPPSALALLLLGLLAGVIGGLLPFGFHHVPATEVIRDLFAAVSRKALQIEGGISTLINGDRNRFLVHCDLPPGDKLESHLLAF